MNKLNLFFGGVLVSGMTLLSVPAFAEEVVEQPPATEEPAVEAPAAPSYVPPAEAYEGVGGWAVVDPETNKVHGVIVCDASACGPDGSKNGVIGHEYMGCHENCVLRFQTRATADGNVAGWGSSEGHDVHWEGDDKGTYTSQQYGSDGAGYSMRITPSQTARDPEGMDLHTGVSDFRVTQRFLDVERGQGVSVETERKQISDEPKIYVNYPAWENRLFTYFSGQSLQDNLSNDVDSSLIEDGYSTSETSIDEETGETVESISVDESSTFVQSIRALTQSVIEFISSLFGVSNV